MNNKKLGQLSTAMSIICTLLMLALPLGMIWFWINFPSNARNLAIAEQQVLQIETIQLWQIGCAATFSVGTTLVAAYGLNQLRRLFDNFKIGQFFTKESVQSMHRFCIALFASTILRVLNTAVLSVLLTLNNGPDKKSLIISIGSNEFWLLFTATTFLAIAWSFKEGMRIADENASFV